MKISIVAVLNEIQKENESQIILNEIQKEKETDSLRNLYEYEIQFIRWSNDNTLDLIEWLDKCGRDYSHLHCKKIPTYDEWFDKIKHYFV